MEVGHDELVVVHQESAAEPDLLTRSVLDIDQHDARVGLLDQIAEPELDLLGHSGFLLLGRDPPARREHHQQDRDRGHRDVQRVPVPSPAAGNDQSGFIETHGDGPFRVRRRKNPEAVESPWADLRGEPESGTWRHRVRSSSRGIPPSAYCSLSDDTRIHRKHYMILPIFLRDNGEVTRRSGSTSIDYWGGGNPPIACPGAAGFTRPTRCDLDPGAWILTAS